MPLTANDIFVTYLQYVVGQNFEIFLYIVIFQYIWYKVIKKVLIFISIKDKPIIIHHSLLADIL